MNEEIPLPRDRASRSDGLGEARLGCISANDSNSETEVVRETYERRNARNSKEERNARGQEGKAAEEDEKKGERTVPLSAAEGKRWG